MHRAPDLRRTLALVVTLAACGLASLAVGRAQAAANAPLALGVNLLDAPDQAAPLQSYVGLAGKRPSIVMWYQQWSEPLFYSDQLPHVAALHALPMITWDPTLDGVGIPLREIANGRFDAYINAAADAAAASKQPMYIRLAHEMNLPDSPFGASHDGDDPASFIAAWRHVVTLFRQQGAHNVEWVWSPNVDCGGSCPFAAYYPGDSWVDWVALDGYNAAGAGQAPWESFAQVFGHSYESLQRLSDKPMMVAETGCDPQGGDKAAWITQTFQTLPVSYPQIRAVVWFDRDKEADWRVDSSPSTLAAWRSVVASPRYAGTPDTLLAAAPLASDVTSPLGTVARRRTSRHEKVARRAVGSHRHAGRVHRPTLKRAV